MDRFSILDRDVHEDEGRGKLLDAGRRAAKAEVNGEIRELDSRIDAFELQFGFSTADLLAKLNASEIEEDETICTWLMAKKVRDHLVQRQTRSH